MGQDSRIEWTDHTFNPWVGCQKVSPGCDRCYAESWDKRFGGERWGPHASRRRTKTWGDPIRWNKQAEVEGRRARVFCASLADVFDNHGSITSGWRGDLWHLIDRTPHLDWLLLTKRPQNIAKMLPDGYGAPSWGNGWHNVWLGTTVENQEEADRRIPHLLGVPAQIHFLSCEPLLGPVDLRNLRRYNPKGEPWIDALRGLVTRGQYLARSPSECSFATSVQCIPPELPRIDWVICGGESGPGARPMHPDWARSLRDQCAAAGVAFHFKQWGEWHSDAILFTDTRGRCPPPNMRIGKKASGRLLDGRTWDEVPR